jgi:hypothetical protein
MTGSSEAHALPKGQISTTLNTTMGPGDTLYLCSGDYGSTQISLGSDGTSTSPKRIIGVDTGSGAPHFSGNGSWSRNDPDSGQWQLLGVNGSYWEVENLELSGVIYAIKNNNTQSGSNLSFKDINIHDVRHGVYLNYVDDSTFENVHVSRYTKHGIRLDRGCDNVSFIECTADMTDGDTSWWDYAEAFPFGFIVDNSGTNTNISFVDCLAQNNRRNSQGISYWNGDGFVVESGNSGISFTGCRSINNEDGGFDIKVVASLQNCVSVKNYRGFRLWSDATLENCVAIYPFRRTNSLPNGVESSAGSGVWTKNGTPSVEYFTYYANNGRGAHEEGSGSITLTDSILAFSGSNGSFTLGNISIGTGTVTYRPSSGTDPDFVNPDISWDGLGGDMNNLTYGIDKGYYDGLAGIQFNAANLSDYSSQSASGSTATIESDDFALHLEGNIWRRYAYSYTVTADTILRVTVEASDGGEIIAVGMDDDDVTNASTNIRLGGDQSNTPTGFYHYSQSYSDGSGSITYEIPLGLYFSGLMSHLTFIADDDADASADVIFSEVDIYEGAPVNALIFDAGGLSDYHGQTASGSTATLLDSDSSIHLEGNIWRKFAYNYTITADTVLEVTVDASDVGEVLAIGFDSNSDYTDSLSNVQLGGSQTTSSGFEVISPVYTANSGAVSYRLPVGSYFTGSMNYITFIADDDADASADITFSNIHVYESPAFVAASFSDYSAQSGSGTFSLELNDTAVHLTGNTWRKHPYSYTITADTILEVTVDADDVGEIIGIGFDTDDDYDDELTTLKFGGSQDAPDNIAAITPSYTAGEGAVTYIIPLGGFFTGTCSYVTFLADDDANASSDVIFSDLRIYESE